MPDDIEIKETKKRGRPKGKKSASTELTAREILLVRHLGEGKSAREAFELAGYGGVFPGGFGEALANVNRKMPSIMRNHGLDEDTLIEKHLKPLLEAQQVKVFNGPDGIVESNPHPALETRRAALDMAFKLSGSYAQPESDKPEGPTQVMVVIQSVSDERIA